MSTTNGGHISSGSWYAALYRLANGLQVGRLVRDREAWIDTWETQTPEQAFFSEYPEYKDQ